MLNIFDFEYDNYQKELVELQAQEYEEIKALNLELEYEPTPEDWEKFMAWCESIEPEVDLDKMYQYFFPE